MSSLSFLSRPVIILNFRNLYSYAVPLWAILPILAWPLKALLHADFVRRWSPFIRMQNTAFKKDISDALRHPEAQQIYRAKIDVPKLSFAAITKMDENGFLTSVAQNILIPETGKTFALHAKEVLGISSFGSICLGQEKESGNWVAIKVQPCSNQAHEQNYLQEAKFLLEQKLLNGIFFDEKKKLFYIIMPLLINHEIRMAPLSDKLAYATIVAKSIQDLHAKNRVHNDIHLGNIRWNKFLKTSRLIDYGSMTHSDSLVESICYPTPRKIHQPEFDWFVMLMMNFKAGDIYSYGVHLADIFSNETKSIPLLKNFIATLQHPLWFLRPTSAQVVKFFQENHSLLNQDLAATKDETTAQKAGLADKISKTELKIIALKNSFNQQPDFLRLALLTNKLDLYERLYTELDELPWRAKAIQEQLFHKKSVYKILKYALYQPNSVATKAASATVTQPTTLIKALDLASKGLNR